MTLYELSGDYRAHALALRQRIRELEAGFPATAEPDRCQVEERIRMLTAMWREARDLAVLCERYYERGYRRNGKYTL